MRMRNCPVCDSNNAEVIMKFTPELLSEINPTYRLDEFKKVMEGKETLLAYSKCRKCRMIYCENMWDDLTLRHVYQNTIDHAKSKDKILSLQKRLGLLRKWLNILRILKLAGEKKLNNLKIIDYGCGWGDFLDVAYGFGVDIMGYDEDTIKIELPKERGHRIAGSIDELVSFSPIDVFVMNSVLEHLQDVGHILDLAKELLKPYGLLVFSVMDYRQKYIKRNVNRVKNNLPALTKNLNPVEHVNIYDYKSVRLTLKKYNFNFISTGHVLYLTDTFLARESMFLVTVLNKIEWLSTKILTGRKLGITVYALNQK